MKIYALVGPLAIVLLSAKAQAQTAQLSGLVTDSQGKAIVSAEISVVQKQTAAPRKTTSGEDGYYIVPALQPGSYVVNASKPGFKTTVLENIVLETAQKATLNVALEVGSVQATVTVSETTPLINRVDATVSTIVDRQFLEAAPLNGRTLQSLYALVPGMIVAPSSSFFTPGQFSVNGQRTSSNYLMVDGVGANVAADFGSLASQNSGGAIPAMSRFGGTNTLASVDALEEVKIQTSSFAPEFGRTPGGQISLTTRSGGNEFHGTVFEYFRNTVLNASDWFANSTAARKAALQQNQYGGTFSGPIQSNRLFFFSSYEGLKLLQPTYVGFNVPSLSLRRSAPPALQPYMNGFAIPNGPDLGSNGLAVYNASFSTLNAMNAGSIRADWIVTKNVTGFIRYNEAPSAQQFLSHPNTEYRYDSRIRTITASGFVTVSSRAVSEVRVNYTDNGTELLANPTDTGNAATLNTSLLLPAKGVGTNAVFVLSFPGYTSPSPPQFVYGNTRGVNRQWNVVHNWNVTNGRHQIKGGIDFRRLTPQNYVAAYGLTVQFTSPSQITAGVAPVGTIRAKPPVLGQVYKNSSAFLQDTWRVLPSLTLTFGLRWEVDPAPSGSHGLSPYAVSGYDDIRTMKLAASNTPLWETRWNNIAPRVGIAWSPGQSKMAPVIRAGFGVFYDTAQSLGERGLNGIPFTTTKTVNNVSFPIDFAAYALQASTTPVPPYNSIFIFDPALKTPYTSQWNLSIETNVSPSDALTVAYVGASGRALVNSRTANLATINPLFATTTLSNNSGFSNYSALQVKWVRRLAKYLDGQAQYTWSHSIDNASSDLGDLNLVKGSSDFDVRHSFGALLTVTSPLQRGASSWISALTRDWTLDITFITRSGLPVGLTTGTLVAPDGTQYSIRPNLIAGQPLWVDDTNTPGHRRINRAAFSAPVGLTPSGTYSSGSLGRNVLTQFPIWQLDFALRRTIPAGERLKVEVRMEAFNALNHPNFGQIQTSLTASNFGQALNMLATQGGASAGGLAAPFQTGGPRSLQASVRLRF